MRIILTVTKGEQEGKVFIIQPGETKIMGRSSKTQLILRDVGVSRLHCQYTNDGGQCSIVDMNSKNGTAVNNQRILTEVQLRDGDTVDIGTTVLSVRLEPDAVAAEQPAQQSATAGLVRPCISEDHGGTRPAVPHPPVAFEEPAEALIVEQPLEPVPAATQPDDVPFAHIPPVDESLSAAADEEGDEILNLETFLATEPSEPPADPAQADAARAEPADAVMGSFDQWLDEGQVAEPPLAQLAEPDEEPIELDPLIDRTLGGCRIIRRRGHDELSTNYEAVQISMERTVTLKILAEQMTSDQDAVDRFIHGAREAGRLSHPNIVQIYDSGQEDELYYVALEHVEGNTVAELLEKNDNRPLSLRQVLDVGTQIAGALDHAHAQSIVHGNIKPTSVLVTPHGVAKLAGLGFARTPAVEAQEPTTLPRDLMFAAPELLPGPDPEASPPDAPGPPADVYSLGAVLFSMLAGREPFEADGVDSFIEIAKNGRPLSLQACNRVAPNQLIAVIEKAMQPQPQLRYTSAAELQSALRGVAEQAR